MNTPPEPNPAPDNTRWTGEKAAAFLKQLARHGKVARAARAVRMSRQAAYRLRARAPKFAELWEIAMVDAARARAAARRARKSVHPLLSKGEQLAREVTPPSRHSDTPAQRASQIDRVALHRARARSHMARER